MNFIISKKFKANICLLNFDSSNKIKNKYDLNHSNKYSSAFANIIIDSLNVNSNIIKGEKIYSSRAFFAKIYELNIH